MILANFTIKRLGSDLILCCHRRQRPREIIRFRALQRLVDILQEKPPQEVHDTVSRALRGRPSAAGLFRQYRLTDTGAEIDAAAAASAGAGVAAGAQSTALNPFA